MSDFAAIVRQVMEQDEQPDYRGQPGISFSQLGVCRRQASYAAREGSLGGAASPSAQVGTLIHAALLPALARATGGFHEVRHEFMGVTGTVDLLTPELVMDLKTVSGRYWDSLASRGYPEKWFWQVTIGCLATERSAGAIMVLNRDTGAWLIVPVDPSVHAERMIAWIEAAQSTEPEMVTRERRGPGIDMECDWCPFLSKCWPGTEAPQTAMVSDDASVVLALASYEKARVGEAEAKKDKAFWRAALDATPGGGYGAFMLTWTPGGVAEVADLDAASELLAQHGLAMPTKTVERARSIGVKRR